MVRKREEVHAPQELLGPVVSGNRLEDREVRGAVRAEEVGEHLELDLQNSAEFGVGGVLRNEARSHGAILIQHLSGEVPNDKPVDRVWQRHGLCGACVTTKTTTRGNQATGRLRMHKQHPQPCRTQGKKTERDRDACHSGRVSTARVSRSSTTSHVQSSLAN